MRSRTIWALASSLHPSAILNVFGLIMIETTLRGCFNHDSRTPLFDMNTFHNKKVSFVIKLIMFRPSVNTA